MASDSTSPPQMVEVRPCGGTMGLGVFATVDIPKGTRVLCEQPTVLFTDLSPQAKSFAQFCAVYKLLDAAKQAILDGLYCNNMMLDEKLPDNVYANIRDEGSYPDDDKDPEFVAMVERFAKFRSNCMLIRGLDSSRSGDPASAEVRDIGTAVFPLHSRINHSCEPNAYSTWNFGITRQTVQAGRDIKAGEQLFISYLGSESTFMEKDQRLVRIVGGWGFFCECAACAHSETNDRIRKKMHDLDWDCAKMKRLVQDSRISEDYRLQVAKEGLGRAKKVIKLLKKSNLGGWKLDQAYRNAVTFSFYKQDFAGVISYTQKSLDYQAAVYGEDLVENFWVPRVASRMPPNFRDDMLKSMGAAS